MDLRRRAIGLGAGLIATLVGLGRAEAQPAGDPGGQESMSQATTQESDMDDTRARAAYRLGRQYYETGRFEEAAVEFERAYGLSGRGELLFNAYLAYREAGDTPNAMRTLRGYLTEVENAPDREHLQARLEYLQQQVTADQEREAQARAEAEAARLAAEEAQRLLEMERSRPRSARPWWPWLLVGGGVAVTATGIALGAVATDDAARLRRDCDVMAMACNPVVDLAGRRSGIQSMAIAGDVLWIGGAAIGIAGIILAFALPDDIIPPEGAPAQPQVTPAAACWGDGCAASLSITF